MGLKICKQLRSNFFVWTIFYALDNTHVSAVSSNVDSQHITFSPLSPLKESRASSTSSNDNTALEYLSSWSDCSWRVCLTFTRLSCTASSSSSSPPGISSSPSAAIRSLSFKFLLFPVIFKPSLASRPLSSLIVRFSNFSVRPASASGDLEVSLIAADSCNWNVCCVIWQYCVHSMCRQPVLPHTMNHKLDHTQ